MTTSTSTRLVAMYVKQAAPGAEIVARRSTRSMRSISLRQKPPRLVFLDLNMPKMSGSSLHSIIPQARSSSSCVDQSSR